MDEIELGAMAFCNDSYGGIEILCEDEWGQIETAFYLDLADELLLRDWLNERHERREVTRRSEEKIEG